MHLPLHLPTLMHPQMQIIQFLSSYATENDPMSMLLIKYFWSVQLPMIPDKLHYIFLLFMGQYSCCLDLIFIPIMAFMIDNSQKAWPNQWASRRLPGLTCTRAASGHVPVSWTDGRTEAIYNMPPTFITMILRGDYIQVSSKYWYVHYKLIIQ